MTSRALSFGAAAAAYERFRPGYPDELVDAVIAYAGRTPRTALEIGAGTGKATRAFAARGIAVTATEPDPAMLAELRRHVPATVLPVRAALEALPPGPAYDLVLAAASLHWTAPEGRWARLAAMLADGGVLAAFGGPMHLTDAAVEGAVAAARSEFLASDDIPPPDGLNAADPSADRPSAAGASADGASADGAMSWPGPELAGSGVFVDVRESVIPRRFSLPAADWVGYLSTVSAYRELPDDVRAVVLDRIARVLPAQVSVTADLTVHLARKG